MPTWLTYTLAAVIFLVLDLLVVAGMFGLLLSGWLYEGSDDEEESSR